MERPCEESCRPLVNERTARSPSSRAVRRAIISSRNVWTRPVRRLREAEDDLHVNLLSDGDLNRGWKGPGRKAAGAGRAQEDQAANLIDRFSSGCRHITGDFERAADDVERERREPCVRQVT